MKTITDKTARRLLYAYHNGQTCPLYAAASSGLVENFYTLAIETRHLHQAATMEGNTKNAAELDKLKTWINAQQGKTARGYIEDNYKQAYNFLSWAEGEPVLKVLSIDAWADMEPHAWSWNQWYNVGTIPAKAIDWTPKKLFKYFRENGYLNPNTQGKFCRDDDQYNIVICDRSNNRPLYAIEYGPIYN